MDIFQFHVSFLEPWQILGSVGALVPLWYLADSSWCGSFGTALVPGRFSICFEQLESPSCLLDIMSTVAILAQGTIS